MEREWIVRLVAFGQPKDGLWVFTDPKLVAFLTDCCTA